MPSYSDSTFEWIKVGLQAVGYLGGWALIVGGWVFTSRDSLKRERRKELRARIDGFIEVIEEIEKNALAYYKTPAGADAPSDSPNQAWLVSALGRLSRGLSRLKKAQNVNVVAQIVRFRQSVTSGDFDSKERLARKDTDPVLHKISVSALELIEHLESEYDRIHP